MACQPTRIHGERRLPQSLRSVPWLGGQQRKQLKRREDSRDEKSKKNGTELQLLSLRSDRYCPSHGLSWKRASCAQVSQQRGENRTDHAFSVLVLITNHPLDQARPAEALAKRLGCLVSRDVLAGPRFLLGRRL